MSCEYENTRNNIIDQYVRGELEETTKESFDIHVYTCDACFDELNFRQSLVNAMRREQEHQNTSRKQTYRIILALAASLVVWIAVMQGYKASLPPYYEQAKLSESDLKELSVGYRGHFMHDSSSFTLASKGLARAHKKGLWGFKPYFDSTQVSLAVDYFTQAYTEETDPIKQNRIAYFIAKAYLMLQDKTQACHWLNRITKEVRMPPGAQSLMTDLDCSSP